MWASVQQYASLRGIHLEEKRQTGKKEKEMGHVPVSYFSSNSLIIVKMRGLFCTDCNISYIDNIGI